MPKEISLANTNMRGNNFKKTRKQCHQVKIVFIQWPVPNEISRKRIHEAKSISVPGGGHSAMKVISEKISKMRQKVEKCKINFELCQNDFQRALKSAFAQKY